MSFSRAISGTIGPIFAPVIEHSLIFSADPDTVLTLKISFLIVLCRMKGLPGWYDIRVG